jgi:hypothetical protein
MPIPENVLPPKDRTETGQGCIEIDPLMVLDQKVINLSNLALSGQITLTEWEERIKKEIGEK